MNNRPNRTFVKRSSRISVLDIHAMITNYVNKSSPPIAWMNHNITDMTIFVYHLTATPSFGRVKWIRLPDASPSLATNSYRDARISAVASKISSYQRGNIKAMVNTTAMKKGVHSVVPPRKGYLHSTLFLVTFGFFLWVRNFLINLVDQEVTF